MLDDEEITFGHFEARVESATRVSVSTTFEMTPAFAARVGAAVQRVFRTALAGRITAEEAAAQAIEAIRRASDDARRENERQWVDIRDRRRDTWTAGYDATGWPQNEKPRPG